VADVTAEVDGVVTADGSRFRGEGLGLPEHLASLFDDILALPAHADDGSRGEEVDESGEERLLGKISVVVGGHL